MILRALAFLACTTALAQQPLPANYQTILDNKDVLVMRVHYGPHEFVPMHDHSAYPTVYVYLNDSGEVRIDHEPPNAFSVTRPPTHTGAFRIAPGVKERHSITNLSDKPSDFLRVELKSISPAAIKNVFRGEAPSAPLTPGVSVVYRNPSLRIDRVICVLPAPCVIASDPASSIVVNVPLEDIGSSATPRNQVMWLPPNANFGVSPNINATANKPRPPFELLRVVLPGN
jgi:hypothetical protein